MGKQDFSTWLTWETIAARYALLALMEERDRLLYVEAPALRQTYMEKIGNYEEEVLASELTAAMLERKIQLIQTALNQRRPVDLEAIEAQLSRERAERLAQLEAADKTAKPLPTLTEAEQQELQAKYRDILRDFHPQVNTDVTDTQRDLYDRALKAYQRQNVQAMRLIYDMLYNVPLPEQTAVPLQSDENTRKEAVQNFADALAEDYALAGELYPCFSPLERDAVLLSAAQRYGQQRQDLTQELEAIRQKFPFNARETLDSQTMTEAYLLQLKARLHQSEETIKERTETVQKMLGAVSHG